MSQPVRDTLHGKLACARHPAWQASLCEIFQMCRKRHIPHQKQKTAYKKPHFKKKIPFKWKLSMIILYYPALFLICV